MPKLNARVRQDKNGYWEAQVQITTIDGSYWWNSLGLVNSREGAWAMVDTYRLTRTKNSPWEYREFEMEAIDD